MEVIRKYFSNLTNLQLAKFEKLESVYKEWNKKINLISRKDFDNFYNVHVLHSLAICKIFDFSAITTFLDVGTGGGFPGIPLAIVLPHCKFTLIDSINKKIKTVENIIRQLELLNVKCITCRAEQIEGNYNFITGRAVCSLPDFVNVVKSKISKKHTGNIQNGILYLKGGNFESELKAVTMKFKIFPLNKIYDEAYFETKKLVYLF